MAQAPKKKSRSIVKKSLDEAFGRNVSLGVLEIDVWPLRDHKSFKLMFGQCL